VNISDNDTAIPPSPKSAAQSQFADIATEQPNVGRSDRVDLFAAGYYYAAAPKAESLSDYIA